MGRSLPTNLTHSTAYLTDKPYDVQLGVLRWIRGLLSEVVDNAVSQLSTTAAGSIHNVEPETQGDDDDDGACGRSAAREVGGNKLQQDEGVDGGEALNLKSRAALLNESVGAATTGSRGDGGSSSTGNGRKRPRTSTPLDGKDIFVPGSVVECFHPDDGLWYPATITAVIAQPPTEAPAVEAHPLAAAPPSDSLLEAAAPAAVNAKHGEGGPTSPAKAAPAAAGGEAEDGGVHSFVMVDSLAAAAAADAGRDSDHSHGPVGTIGGAAATETPAEVGAALEVAAAKNSSELYGDNNWRGAATWSGRHVRFSEEDGGEGEEGGDVVEVGNNDSSNGGQERENALYEAWMAT